MRSKREVSWLKEGYGMLPRVKCWKTEVPRPQIRISIEGMPSCAQKKTFSEVGCARRWKEEQLNLGGGKKPEKMKVKVGTERWREERRTR